MAPEAFLMVALQFGNYLQAYQESGDNVVVPLSRDTSLKFMRNKSIVVSLKIAHLAITALHFIRS